MCLKVLRVSIWQQDLLHQKIAKDADRHAIVAAKRHDPNPDLPLLTEVAAANPLIFLNLSQLVMVKDIYSNSWIKFNIVQLTYKCFRFCQQNLRIELSSWLKLSMFRFKMRKLSTYAKSHPLVKSAASAVWLSSWIHSFALATFFLPPTSTNQNFSGLRRLKRDPESAAQEVCF